MAAWIVFCTLCSSAGWVLSALHQLNAVGYVVTFLAALAAAWLFRKHWLAEGAWRWNLRTARQRFRRPFPLVFLVLAALAILGGALYAPCNYDALAYRLPRMLHWLAAEQWHWIHTDFQRVNTRACGIEWLSTPLIAFTKTDRLLFLINAVSFCFLPGLVFSLFTRVGVRPRAAWHWMWLLPTGYCYLLQAGSIANDMFSAVYALAAIDFALRARQSRRISDVCLSILSAALLVGAKASNLPLLLPWAIAILPTWRLWLARPLALLAIIPFSLGASFLPMAVLNRANCGDWTGAAAEQMNIGAGPLWLHLLGNGINWTLHNVVPPVFPLTSAWNRAADAMTPASLRALMEQNFEPVAAHWRLPELQVEEQAGLGFGVTVLVGLSVLAVILGRKRLAGPTAARPADPVGRLICLASWVSLLYAMAKLNLSGGPRYLANYYCLLSMGLLLSPAQAVLVRARWWRSCAFIVFGLAGLLLFISPSRPLWPAGWFVEHYGPRLKSSKLGSVAINAYETKSRRSDVFAPFIASLPADATVVGFEADDFPETSLWKPFGSRRILHVKATDSGEEMRRRGLKYVLVTSDRLKEPWPDWLQRTNARELHTETLKIWGGLPPLTWHLVELNSQDTNPNPSNPQPKPAHES